MISRKARLPVVRSDGRPLSDYEKVPLLFPLRSGKLSLGPISSHRTRPGLSFGLTGSERERESCLVLEMKIVLSFL